MCWYVDCCWNISFRTVVAVAVCARVFKEMTSPFTPPSVVPTAAAPNARVLSQLQTSKRHATGSSTGAQRSLMQMWGRTAPPVAAELSGGSSGGNSTNSHAVVARSPVVIVPGTPFSPQPTAPALPLQHTTAKVGEGKYDADDLSIR
jgi:hypothetical protein